jgi:phosphopantothenoylcysteine synthetase/decarboxylase
MTFKLSIAKQAERDNLVDALREKSEKIRDAMIAFNEEMERRKDDVILVLNEYNGLMEEARVFAAGVGETAEEAIEEKSEKWQESDAGEKAANFASEWNNADLFDHEIEFPDPLDPEAPDHATTLEDLPEE